MVTTARRENVFLTSTAIESATVSPPVYDGVPMRWCVSLNEVIRRWSNRLNDKSDYRWRVTASIRPPSAGVSAL
jgi:hypothetical protein